MSFFRRAGSAIARIFQSAVDPAAEADKVLLYSKDAAGVAQLFARSDDGIVHQLTPPAAGSSLFVWQVGVPWATIYAQMLLVPGPKICLVEWTAAGFVMTAGTGPTNLNDIYFWGIDDSGLNANVFISVSDGFTLATKTQFGGNVAHLQSKDIRWTFNCATTPIATFTSSSDYVVINIDGGRLASGQRMINGDVKLRAFNGATIQGSAPVLIRVFSSGTSSCELYSAAQLSGFVFTDDGTGKSLTVRLDAGCKYNGSLANMFGTSVPTMVINNYTQNAAKAEYRITVDGGGNLIATAV
jgi:hypothetical protein